MVSTEYYFSLSPITSFTYDCPSRIKDLRPLARPVEDDLPPKATVMAERQALFPPAENMLEQKIARAIGAKVGGH